jgi:PAS domain S-box-containing protein
MKSTDKIRPKPGQGQKKPEVQSGKKKQSLDKCQRPEISLQTSEEKFQRLFETAQDGILLLDAETGIITEANPFIEELLGYSRTEIIGKKLWEIGPFKDVLASQDSFLELQKKRYLRYKDLPLETKDGRRRDVEFVSNVYRVGSQNVIQCNIRDITELRQVEEAAQTSEERFRHFFTAAREGLFIHEQGVILDVNEGGARMFGYEVDELIGKNIQELAHPDSVKVVKEKTRQGIEGAYEANGLCKDRSSFPAELYVRNIAYQGRQVRAVAIWNLSDRKQAEETLRASELRYRGLFEDSPISLWEEDFSAVKRQLEKLGRQGVTDFRDFFESHPDVLRECVKKIKVIDVNKATLALVRATKKAQLIGNLKQIIRIDSCDDFVDEFVGIAEGKTEFEWEGMNRTLDGEELTVSLHWSTAPGYEDTLEKVLVSMIDITGRRRMEKALALRTEELRQRNEELTRLNEQAERRMQRLVSMRTIDMAISGSFDVGVVLGIVLDQVTGQLGSHAADILLFNQGAQTFKFSCGRGFRIQGLEHSHYKFGSDLAWRVIRERLKVEISDLKAQENVLQRSPDLSGEGFLSYIGVPLVSKGQVRGVLEVFHREQLNPDREWYNYLEMLAGQAAIAIDNAELFEHMQSSNTELAIAYDSTLVSWANALELRALEPQGHTRRVDNLATRLGQVLGLNDNDLVHIHRGALLHDIGKMGIPDSIMLKPGPLTEGEWEIMRRHPQIAFDMLFPIAYLRPALDIPNYHHEKWDGTGYPRGLKGENIPLAARIFAVVDVWDMLTSGRPYRKAWSEMEAHKYIHQQAGLHFDPLVVKTFLELSINRMKGA